MTRAWLLFVAAACAMFAVAGNLSTQIGGFPEIRSFWFGVLGAAILLAWGVLHAAYSPAPRRRHWLVVLAVVSALYSLACDLGPFAQGPFPEVQIKLGALWASALVVVWALQYAADRFFTTHTSCRHCGYDLRGQDWKCPECGVKHG